MSYNICSFSEANPLVKSFLTPYYAASKHLTIAWEGKVQSAAQRVFAQQETAWAGPLSLRERVLHALSGLALSLPLINNIYHYFFERLGLLIPPADGRTYAEAPRKGCLKKPGQAQDKPARQVAVGGARARPFRKGDAPAAVGVECSIELVPLPTSTPKVTGDAGTV